MQIIENIILDYGNVIFMLDFAKLQNAFTQLGIADTEEIFAHHGQIALFDDFDKGLLSSTEFRDGIRKLTNNSSLNDNEIDKAWNALLLEVPEGRHEVLLKLKEKYRTFLLSNNNEIHYSYCMNHINEKYGVKDNEEFFERTYYSHLVGMRKPDLNIFHKVIDENGLNPNKTLFIDDSPQHLKKAETLGINTALCTEDKPLEVILKEWNLM